MNKILSEYCSSSTMKHITFLSLAACVLLLITFAVCDSSKSESSPKDPLEQPIEVGDFSSEEFEDYSSEELGDKTLLANRMASVRRCFKGYRYSKSLGQCLPILNLKGQRT
ncbi:uncharacterized protein LOC126569862 [Anopheles aquasalis]|uniref:uncharacterized protein LOC126569862 n=1 Tax=Anopheles aquasalis TaxID=42839 RepID=UPI00215A1BBF|nr:uncharacterized protein LOC126569862 [Anopheles aquasalis]